MPRDGRLKKKAGVKAGLIPIGAHASELNK